eukprot:scaffold57111_cov31-Tisochrysis_lutea.AAC.2
MTALTGTSANDVKTADEILARKIAEVRSKFLQAHALTASRLIGQHHLSDECCPFIELWSIHIHAMSGTLIPRQVRSFYLLSLITLLSSALSMMWMNLTIVNSLVATAIFSAISVHAFITLRDTSEEFHVRQDVG